MSTDEPAEPSTYPETVERILDLALDRPPTVGTGRLVCVDGPAGAGKTTLGEALAHGARRLVASTRLIHMDDLFEGWEGLPEAGRRLRQDIVDPLAEGRSGSYRRWDWLAGGWAETHVVDPVSLLVVEGVGSGSAEVAERIGILVWVEAPDDLRLARGLARDGAGLRHRWQQWMADERAHFRRHATQNRADVTVDAYGRIVGVEG